MQSSLMSAPPQQRRMATPLGCLKRLDNKLAFCFVELTNNEDDPENGSMMRSKLPSANEAREQQQQSGGDGARNIALFFSHMLQNPQELFSVKKNEKKQRFMYNTDFKPRADVSGVVFDRVTVDEMKKGDVYFELDRESGNILAAFIMPFGWNSARANNSICHNCGAFPARIFCQRCDSGRFCSTQCILRAKRSNVHSAEVCDAFIKARVTAGCIRQFEYNIADLNEMKK